MVLDIDLARPEDIDPSVELAAAAQPQDSGLEGAEFGSPLTGFLTQLSRREAELLWSEGTVLVAHEAGRLIGFISGFRSDTDLFRALLEQTQAGIRWDRPGVPEIPGLVYADRWIVRPEERREGVAMALYHAFRKQFPDAPILTAVVEAPPRNYHMENLIGRLGFERVGCYRAESFRGLKDYQSGIYLRARGGEPPGARGMAQAAIRKLP